MALGASAPDVLQLVVIKALLPLSTGLALGLAGSFALTRYLKSALHEVTTDPTTYIGVSLLATVAVVACLVAALRAVSVNPTGSYGTSSSSSIF
jgi:hypothetical protein